MKNWGEGEYRKIRGLITPNAPFSLGGKRERGKGGNQARFGQDYFASTLFKIEIYDGKSNRFLGMVQNRVAVLIKAKIVNTLKNNDLCKMKGLKTATQCYSEH